MGDLLLKAICETTVPLCMVVHHIFCILNWRYCTTNYCTITNKFLFRTASLLMWIISLLVIERASYQEGWKSSNLTRNCIITGVHINSNWMLIPSFMSGLSNFLLILSALEFIWSQAPMSMKGFALGCMYALLG